MTEFGNTSGYIPHYPPELPSSLYYIYDTVLLEANEAERTGDFKRAQDWREMLESPSVVDYLSGFQKSREHHDS